MHVFFFNSVNVVDISVGRIHRAVIFNARLVVLPFLVKLSLRGLGDLQNPTGLVVLRQRLQLPQTVFTVHSCFITGSRRICLRLCNIPSQIMLTFNLWCAGRYPN